MPKEQKIQLKNNKRVELEKKAVEGAKKALREYHRVFERLAEYDRDQNKLDL